MLGWFLLPYKGSGISRTSHFMRWHGEKFFGRPEELGLKNVLPDIKDSYYNLVVDRPIENHGHELETWSRGQQHAEEVRQISKAEIPKATFLAVLVVSLGCALIASPFAKWEGSAIGNVASVVKDLDFKKAAAAASSLLSMKSDEETLKDECTLIAKIAGNDIRLISAADRARCHSVFNAS